MRPRADASSDPRGKDSAKRDISDTLSIIDKLLGTQAFDVAQAPTPAKEQGGDDGDKVGWWDQPVRNQDQTPQTRETPSGQQGNFLQADDPLTQAGWRDAAVGRPTDAASGAYDIPMVTPRLTYLLLGVNLAVYSAGVYIAITQGNDASNDYFLALAKVNDKVFSGEWYRMLTSTFMHAGLLHLGLNTAALRQLGPEAEAVLGYATFAVVYFLSGLAGASASLLSNDLTTVGASASIFGLLGAMAGYFLRNREIQNSGRQLAFIGAVAALNLALGTAQGSLIDNTGHAAGLVCGLSLGLLMAPKFVVIREPRVPDRARTLSPWTGNPTPPAPGQPQNPGSPGVRSPGGETSANPSPEGGSASTATSTSSEGGARGGEEGEGVAGEAGGGLPGQARPDLWQVVVVDQTTFLQRAWGAALGVLVVGALFAAALLSRGGPTAV